MECLYTCIIRYRKFRQCLCVDEKFHIKISIMRNIIISVGFLFVIADAARILAIYPYPVHSHQVHNHALTLALAERGHQLTVFTANPMRKNITNYTEWPLSMDCSSLSTATEPVATNSASVFAFFHFAYKSAQLITDQLLSHPEIQNYLSPNAEKKFDVVIVAAGYHEGTHVIAYKLKIPLLGITSLPGTSVHHFYIGNPLFPSIFPDPVTGYTKEMNFFERLHNFYIVMRQIFEYKYISTPMQQAVLNKHFGTDAPKVEAFHSYLSMLFLNTHPILHYPRPMVPRVIPILGWRTKTMNTSLPESLKKLLDDAKQGFIYFSLESNIKSVDVRGNFAKNMMAAFAELPYLVLWKFEADSLPGKPDNVVISKWIPQQGVLAHPNIKLFIYQGGMQSTEEAIHAGVVLLGIPMFFDQKFTATALTSKGVMLTLEGESITKERVKDTINELILNPKYKRNMLQIRRLLRDRPKHPIDEAIWWTEYVIGHNGTPYFQTESKPLYQIEMWDIYSFLGVILSIIIFITWKIFRKMIHIIRNSNKKSLNLEKVKKS